MTMGMASFSQGFLRWEGAIHLVDMAGVYFPHVSGLRKEPCDVMLDLKQNPLVVVNCAVTISGPSHAQDAKMGGFSFRSFSDHVTRYCFGHSDVRLVLAGIGVNPI